MSCGTPAELPVADLTQVEMLSRILSVGMEGEALAALGTVLGQMAARHNPRREQTAILQLVMDRAADELRLQQDATAWAERRHGSRPAARGLT